MAFDVDALRAARRPWEFHFRGRTFIARHVSAPDCERFETMRTMAKRPKQHEIAWYWILRRAFPWGPRYWIMGDPVKIILKVLEPHERVAALSDFFARLQGRSPTDLQQTNQRDQRTNSTNGTSSRGSTPRQRA